MKFQSYCKVNNKVQNAEHPFLKGFLYTVREEYITAELSDYGHFN